ERHAVAALHPVERVLGVDRRGLTRARGRGAADVRQARAEREVEAARRRRRIVPPELGLELGREERGATGLPDAELVDQVGRQRRTQRLRRRPARGLLAARDREAREERLTRVSRVGRRADVLVVVRRRQAVLLREVVVDTNRRVVVERLAL